MAKQVLAVSGMSCGHCKMAVEKAAGAVPGVLEVDADVRKGRVTVSYRDDSETLERVKAAIGEAGYTVTG